MQGFQTIELNVDCLVVANAVILNGRGNLMAQSLIAKIHHLLDLEWEVVVKYSYREANQCAGTLANQRCSLTSDVYFFESCSAVWSLAYILCNEISIPHLILVYDLFPGISPLCRKKSYVINVIEAEIEVKQGNE